MIKEEKRVADAKRYQENKEEIKTKVKKYWQEHKEETKVTRRAYDKIYNQTKNGKLLMRCRTAKHRAMKLNQTPPDADLDKIKEIYKNCPKGYEVDHIHPISKGGLHHEDNLQYLTAYDNRRKGAKILK